MIETIRKHAHMNFNKEAGCGGTHLQSRYVEGCSKSSDTSSKPVSVTWHLSGRQDLHNKTLSLKKVNDIKNRPVVLNLPHAATFITVPCVVVIPNHMIIFIATSKL